MPDLAFQSLDHLAVVLRSGTLPEKMLAEPVGTYSLDGRLVVRVSARVDRQLTSALSKLGVDKLRARSGVELIEAGSWPELYAPEPAPEPESPLGYVLFLVSAAKGTSLNHQLGTLVTELLRLGCDRQELCAFDSGDAEHVLVRALDPPYFSVLNAQPPAVRAFTPARRGGARLWVEIGWSHPFLEQLVAPPEQQLLLHGNGTLLRAPAGPFEHVYKKVSIEVPPSLELEPGETPRLDVKPRLIASTLAPEPRLWVIRENGLAQVEQLLERATEDLQNALELGIASDPDGEELFVLRARRGAHPLLTVSAESYAGLAAPSQLHVPLGWSLEPPLSPERLFELLVPSDRSVVWLRATGGGQFTPESLPESAFRPLPELVDYIIDRAREQLEPWLESAVFDFESFVGVELRAAPAAEDEASQQRRRRRREEEDDDEPDAGDDDELESSEADAGEVVEMVLPAQRRGFDAGEVEQLEQQLREQAAPLDHTQLARWVALAEAYAHDGRGDQAGLCWSQALWDSDPERQAAIAQRWAQVDELPLRRGSVDGNPTHDGKLLRALVPWLLLEAQRHERAAAGEPRIPLETLRSWVDTLTQVLDVRSAWIAQKALSDLSGHDALALMRARDTLGERMQGGLSIGRDAPAFVRLAGGGRERGSQLGAALERLLGEVLGRRRKRSALEAPVELTHPYVNLIFAWGFARLGFADRARQLEAENVSQLPENDPIHAYLVAAFSARISQALACEPPWAQLPLEVQRMGTGLDRMQRFKVDRLVSVSRCLSTTDRPNAFQRFTAASSGAADADLAAWIHLETEEARAGRLEELVAAATSQGDEGAELLGGVLDLLSLLSPGRAALLLERVVEALIRLPSSAGERSVHLVNALLLAGSLERRPLVERLLAELPAAGEDAAVGEPLRRSAPHLSRLGLGDAVVPVIEDRIGACPPGALGMRERLELAAALAAFGDDAPLQAALGEAFGLVEGLKLGEKHELLPVIATSLGHTSPETAIAGADELLEQLPTITDSLSTRTHFCLSLLCFAEALVLACASEELMLSDWARDFLADSEHRVRLRIHRDLSSREYGFGG